jgi:hypothetical protein
VYDEGRGLASGAADAEPPMTPETASPAAVTVKVATTALSFFIHIPLSTCSRIA